jgi:hypothetical protein
MRAHANAHSKGTVASNDMQHIDLCEPDNMPVNNMALELLSPQHEAMINWRILRASANNGCMRVCVRPRMKKGYIHSNNENNQNKWCAACGCMQTCLGMRMRCSTAEWHGLHGYSGVSVAHDLCLRVRVCACLCGIVGTYLCCHGLRCGSSSRRPAHGRLDSRSFSVPPCRRLRRILCCVHLYQLRLVGKYATDNMPSSGARASVTISHSARTI